MFFWIFLKVFNLSLVFQVFLYVLGSFYLVLERIGFASLAHKVIKLLHIIYYNVHEPKYTLSVIRLPTFEYS